MSNLGLRIPRGNTNDDPANLKTQVIGQYQQTRTATIRDKDGAKHVIEPGKYPVVGTISPDGRKIHEGGIIFGTRNAQTGKLHSVVEFRRPDELARFVQSGRLQLAQGVARSMLGDDRKQTQTQARTHKQGHGLRR